MVKLTDTTNTTTLFQFNTTDKVISNPESMLEKAEFFTTVKGRNGLKSIVKRNTGLKNKQLHLRVVLSGTSRDTNAATLLGILENNEFFYLNTESFQTRLDGIYAPNGTLSQKRDQHKLTITIDFDLIEQEDA